MSLNLDLTSPTNDSYKYFETTTNVTNDAMAITGDAHASAHNLSVIDHNYELTSLPDPSLRASAFWRIFPHVVGLLFLWFLSALYFNGNLWIFYPLLFLPFILLLMFLVLFQSSMFERSCIPALFNNLSWSVWSFIAFWVVLNIAQESLTLNFNATTTTTTTTVERQEFPAHKMQIEILCTSIFLTALSEQIFECYLCHRTFERYFVNGAGFASVNCLILYCAVIGLGVGVAKSLISVALLGNSTADHLHQGFLIDFKYALLDYAVIPFIANHEDDTEHEWVFVLLSALVFVTFHATVGMLWGVSFVRRYVLEHTLAFSQMLMFPWFALTCVHVIIAEVFYNVLDYNFAGSGARSIYLSVCICAPLFFGLFNIGATAFLYRRTIAPAVNQTKLQNAYDMAM